jgi:small-conductance mechanosensitive channel
VRAITGREAIVPNEMLLTSRVENLSLADPRVVQTTRLLVAFDADVPRAMALMATAARAHSRVLTSPAPSVQLSQFVPEGIELTLVYWIADLENGQGNLRSELNLALWQAFAEQGIALAGPARNTPASAVAATLPL